MNRSEHYANEAIASYVITQQAMHMHAQRTVRAARHARKGNASFMQRLMRSLGLTSR